MPNSRWCYIIGTLFPSALFILGLPWLFSWWRIRLQCRRPWFNSWVEKIPQRRHRLPTVVFLGFTGGSDGKESTCNAGELGSIPGLGRSPGEGKSYHSSILAWRIPWTTVHGVAESDMTEPSEYRDTKPGDTRENTGYQNGRLLGQTLRNIWKT